MSLARRTLRHIAPRSLRGRLLRDAAARVAPLGQAYDLLSEHVVITDADAHILYANAAAERATGFRLQDMLGRNPADLWGGKMPPGFYAALWKRIKKEKLPFAGEVRNVRRDGKEVWQDMRISPVLDPRGRVRYFVAVESGVTARKRKEGAREELESVVSHDALSPLAAVRWIVEGMLSARSLPAAQRKALKEAHREALRAIAAYDDLAFLSREGRGHPAPETLDLRAMAAECAGETGARMPSGGRGAAAVRAVPSLARACMHEMLAAAGKDAACSVHRAAGRVEVRVETEAKGRGAPDLHAASLLAKYLRWELTAARAGGVLRMRLLAPAASLYTSPHAHPSPLRNHPS